MTGTPAGPRRTRRVWPWLLVAAILIVAVVPDIRHFVALWIGYGIAAVVGTLIAMMLVMGLGKGGRR